MAVPHAKLSDVSVVDWKGRNAFYSARGAWQQWVRSDGELSSTAKVAAWEISDRMSPETDGAWPSQRLIAARIGCGERTARSAVDELLNRAWLMARRGGFEGKAGENAKSGFRQPYCYLMTASESVLRSVVESERNRVAKFKDNRLRLPSRDEIDGILRRALPAENGRSHRQEMAGHTGRNLPLIPAENGRTICTEKLANEPVNEICEDKWLGDREQDEATSLPSPSPTYQRDEDEPVLSLRELLIEALGDGNVRDGRLIADAIGPHRCDFLMQMIEDVGAWRARPQIRDAVADVRERLNLLAPKRMLKR